MYTAFGEKSNTRNMCNSEVIFKRIQVSNVRRNVDIKLLITYNKSVYEYCH